MNHSILVVDDSKVLRLMIVSVLKKAGVSSDIDEADDGVEGLKLVAGRQYDLVITDLNMPNMGGIDFVKKIRISPVNKFVKICVLSGESDKEMEDEARKAGASAFLLKPFEPLKLLAAIKKLLQ
ncbi:MAG: response regulator [Gammaproteobacteria bacterium]|jgi:two-component system chemotaxis response regulator CheY|nr:response regulator [Gammaproteobacteria bacterium]MBT3724104.1 response regulator [Gammaproteobacteria bacterium]MBT4076077.1 response regulator [Gammaproteobacteria bacterium]MBT4194855.1 response regulator [Gammaproteobacteria bacterium]MBT4449818.1 response regulator [Gammaproteobacteria bacterium]